MTHKEKALSWNYANVKERVAEIAKSPKTQSESLSKSKLADPCSVMSIMGAMTSLHIWAERGVVCCC
jgi:hypothetical protein